jgi:hypothetical protein
MTFFSRVPRVSEFQVEDEAGSLQPVESMDYAEAPLFLTGMFQCPIFLLAARTAPQNVDSGNISSKHSIHQFPKSEKCLSI